MNHTKIKPIGSFAKDVPMSLAVKLKIIDQETSDFLSEGSRPPQDLSDLYNLLTRPDWIQIAQEKYDFKADHAENIRVSTLAVVNTLSAHLK